MLSFCLIYCHFQSSVAYKSVAYENEACKSFSYRNFSFSAVDKKEIVCQINKLKSQKPVHKILTYLFEYGKKMVIFLLSTSTYLFNQATEISKFPSLLKLTNITRLFKNVSKNQKENYRAANILPILYKIFEKILSKQLSSYFENVLSEFQCSFRDLVVR